jgi:hypothetical protein
MKIYSYNILANSFIDVSGGQTFNGAANPAGYRFHNRAAR